MKIKILTMIGKVKPTVFFALGCITFLVFSCSSPTGKDEKPGCKDNKTFVQSPSQNDLKDQTAEANEGGGFLAPDPGKMPEFPGGQKALTEYIRDNVHYPELAREAGTEGKVLVSFTVDKAGKVTDVKIMKGVSPELDAEALRVVRMMPSWKPGFPGSISMTLPIQFKLAEAGMRPYDWLA